MPHIPKTTDCTTPILTWPGRTCFQVQSLHCSFDLALYHILGAYKHLANGRAGTHRTGPGSMGFICAEVTRATVPPAPCLLAATVVRHGVGVQPGTGSVGSPAPPKLAGWELPRNSCSRPGCGCGPRFPDGLSGPRRAPPSRQAQRCLLPAPGLILLPAL